MVILDEKHGVLMSASEPAPLRPGALETVLARLDTPTAQDDDRPESGSPWPAVVGRFGLGPRRHLSPGLWAAPLVAPRTDDWRAFLIRMPAGSTIPHHGHRGGELVAVLEGAFHDGQTYRRGDFVENLPAADHQLKITSDTACTCLIAVQGALLWQGWARIIGPALGI